jgi:hypothetical protein
VGAVKAAAEKTSTTASATRSDGVRQPFIARAGGGDFVPRVQTKMTVNKPGDKFEQEADKTADKVMRMATPGADKLQRQAEDKVQKAPADEQKVQRREEEKILRAAALDDKIQKADAPKIQKADAPHRAEEKILRATDDKVQKAEDHRLQKAPGGEEKLRDAAPAGGGGAPAVAGDVQSSINNKTIGGEPLASDVRSYMEPRFNADFSNVRIHRDAESASLNNQLSARAFTYQNHIFFSHGQYQPGTSDGRHLLAHELTHTIQQGRSVQRKAEISRSAPGGHSAAAIQRAPAGAAPAAMSSEIVNIASSAFNPSQKMKDEIEVQKSRGLDVRVITKGLTGEGRVKIRVDGGGNYSSIGKGSMPLLNPWTQELGGMHVNFSVGNNEIKPGYASFKPGGGDTNDWLQSLQKASSALGGLGLKVGSLPPSLVNAFDNGKLTLGVKNLDVEVGGFVSAQFDVSVENMDKPKVEANAGINIKGVAKGKLKLNNTAGTLAGEISLAVDYPSFSGAANVKYNADGSIDVGGKAAYNANKLSGEVQFVSTDLDSANRFAKDAIAAAGGVQNVQEASPPGPVPQPKAGQKQRALAATGQLGFNLNKWFAGTVNVVVDGKGAITVIGKIAPPGEIELFKQKDWDETLVQFEAKAYYGIPVVGNLNLFANIGLHAIAKLGPAKIHNIEILGTYSTDPEVQKSIQISGSINISGYGGLRLHAEGGAGVEILSHDIKFGIGLNADVGVKAYADARPTIGYRDPGTFYISGTLELLAQPELGLGGDFFIALETPWWSPLSDDRWTWPLFSKEWPLTEPIGISASVKDYELGSGKVPEIEMKKPNFDPSKFMTSMVDKNLPDKSGGPGAAQGSFKEDGSVQKPVVPPKKPAPKSAPSKPIKKGAPLKGGKSMSPDQKAAKDQQTTKIFESAARPLAALKNGEALTRSALDKELAKIKAQARGIAFDVKVKGAKWAVTPRVGEKSTKNADIPAKDVSQKDKAGAPDERTEEQKNKDKLAAIADAEKLVSPVDFDEKEIRRKLAPIKSRYRLLTLDLKVDSETDKKEMFHFAASASTAVNSREITVVKNAAKEAQIAPPRTRTLGGDTVGVEMTADWLGAEPKGGSPPKPGVQKQLMSLLVTNRKTSSESKYIRGHLLNHHLGGEGEAYNMFPITGNANSQHLHSTESKIKLWVKEPNRWVYYQVRVENISAKLDPPPKSPSENYVNCTFVCKAVQKDAAGAVKNELATQIPSTYGFREEHKVDIAPT